MQLVEREMELPQCQNCDIQALPGSEDVQSPEEKVWGQGSRASSLSWGREGQRDNWS